MPLQLPRLLDWLYNRGFCLRLVTAMCVEQSEEWVSGLRYLDMEQLWEWQASRRQECELVLA